MMNRTSVEFLSRFTGLPIISGLGCSARIANPADGVIALIHAIHHRIIDMVVAGDIDLAIGIRANR